MHGVRGPRVFCLPSAVWPLPQSALECSVSPRGALYPLPSPQGSWGRVQRRWVLMAGGQAGLGPPLGQWRAPVSASPRAGSAVLLTLPPPAPATVLPDASLGRTCAESPALGGLCCGQQPPPAGQGGALRDGRCVAARSEAGPPRPQPASAFGTFRLTTWLCSRLLEPGLCGRPEPVPVQHQSQCGLALWCHRVAQAHQARSSR